MIVTGSYAESLKQPITLDELRAALRKGGSKKTPGSDGNGLEFYTTNWEIINEDIHEITDQTQIQRGITAQQKHGVVVCLPKSSAALTPDEYRPITLLNTDYKNLARILAHRSRPVLEHHLRTSQFCSVPRTSIAEAVSTVREATAQAEMSDTPLCVLTLDFQAAFDRLSQWRTGGGGFGVFEHPPSEIPKSLQNRAKLNPISENC